MAVGMDSICSRSGGDECRAGEETHRTQRNWRGPSSTLLADLGTSSTISPRIFIFEIFDAMLSHRCRLRKRLEEYAYMLYQAHST